MGQRHKILKQNFGPQKMKTKNQFWPRHRIIDCCGHWWKTQPWPNPTVCVCSQLVDRSEILASHWLSGSSGCEDSAELCAHGNMATGLAVAEICTANSLKHKSCPLCTQKVANSNTDKVWQCIDAEWWQPLWIMPFLLKLKTATHLFC